MKEELLTSFDIPLFYDGAGEQMFQDWLDENAMDEEDFIENYVTLEELRDYVKTQVDKGIGSVTLPDDDPRDIESNFKEILQELFEKAETKEDYFEILNSEGIVDGPLLDRWNSIEFIQFLKSQADKIRHKDLL